MKFTPLFLNLALLILVASACRNKIPNELPVSETEQVFPTSTPTILVIQSPPVNDNNATLTQLVEKAKADLAERLSIPAEKINPVETKAVIWPDSSLGCPQPGMVYAQVQVEGLLIRLGVGKEIYFYHSGEGEDPFLCESISPFFPKSTPKNDELIPPPGSDID